MPGGSLPTTGTTGVGSGSGLGGANAPGSSLAQPLLPFPQLPSTAPQSYSSSDFNAPFRGVASLTFNGRTWRFRTNPNSVSFSYSLNTHVDQTFGGRVIQLLSCKIDDLVIEVEAGNAGWAYAANLALWLRDYLDYQRTPNAIPAVFQYTTRGWKFSVYALSIPFQDQVEAVTRPMQLNFKVQEDISGVVSGAILDGTLAKLQDGIGWRRDKFDSGSSYGVYNGPNSGQTQPTVVPATTPTPGATSPQLPLPQNTALQNAPSSDPIVNI